MTDDFVQVTWNEQLEDDCRQIVRLAVREDLDRQCDWTTVSLVAADATAAAFVVVREPGVIAGLRVAELALDEMQTNVVMQFLHADGDLVTAGTPVARLDGSARDLLSSERILLNLIGRMSGVASLTRQYVECVAETKARIYDTRKTTPGWRRLEKYAVRAGGGVNHRTGLFAAVMIKDNHLALSAQRGLTPSEAVRQTREFLNSALETKSSTPLIVEVEVDTVEQLQEVLDAKPDLVLLDNMTSSQLARCVSIRDTKAPQIQLEASGGVQLETVREIAETGVDRISVGALTHSAKSLDVALDWA